jgi:hypothetical protein
MSEEPQGRDDQPSPVPEELAEQELNEIAGGNGSSPLLPPGPHAPGG